jgi:hypothetical protein
VPRSCSVLAISLAGLIAIASYALWLAPWADVPRAPDARTKAVLAGCRSFIETITQR